MLSLKPVLCPVAPAVLVLAPPSIGEQLVVELRRHGLTSLLLARLPQGAAPAEALVASAAAVIDAAHDEAVTDQLTVNAPALGRSVVVVNGTLAASSAWRLPFAGGGCWACVRLHSSTAVAAPSASAGSTVVSGQLLAWAADMAASAVADQVSGLADVYTLAEDDGSGSGRRPVWSCGPLVRHPRCLRHVGEPPMFEQMALMPCVSAS